MFSSVILIVAWTDLLGQWTQADSVPGSWRTMALFADSGRIFAGTNGGGVFLSQDNGGSWVALNNGLTDRNVSVLASQGTYLFAGTSGTSGGIYRSTDSGGTWTRVRPGIIRGALVVKGPSIFAGVSTAVLISTDSGATWTTVNNGLPGPGTTIRSLAAGPSRVFAGTGTRGVFWSSDNGANWIAPDSLSPIADKDVRSLAVNGRYVYAGTSDSGMYVSPDSGATWSPLNAGLPSGANTVFAMTALGDTVLAGVYSLTGTDTLMDVFYSVNGGSWAPFAAGLPKQIIYSLAVNRTHVLAGTGSNGVFMAPHSSITVERQNSSLAGRPLLSLHPNPFRSSVAVFYELAAQAPVYLSVYDVRGARVADLVHGTQLPGKHGLAWRPQGIRDGVYFIQGKIGGKRMVRKVQAVR
jgi:photosystem II stability/assembly factor-like uncharacterized protein